MVCDSPNPIRLANIPSLWHSGGSHDKRRAGNHGDEHRDRDAGRGRSGADGRQPKRVHHFRQHLHVGSTERYLLNRRGVHAACSGSEVGRREHLEQCRGQPNGRGPHGHPVHREQCNSAEWRDYQPNSRRWQQGGSRHGGRGRPLPWFARYRDLLICRPLHHRPE